MFGESNYKKAVDLYNSSKYQEAIPKFIKAAESGDLNEANVYNSLVYLGACCIGLEQYDSAIVNLKKALEWDAEFYWAYFELGRAYFNKEEYEAALYNFNKAIEGREGYLYSWYNKGITLERLGSYDDAISSLKTALKLAVSENSNFSQEIKMALNRVTNARYDCIHSRQLEKIEQLQENKDYNTAISMCKEMLDAGKLNEEHLFTVHCKLGECYSEIKQNLMAISEYNAALQIDSESLNAVSAFMGLFEIYAARIEYDEATDVINKTIRIAETNMSDQSLSNEEKLRIQKLSEILQLVSRSLSLVKDKKYNELLDLCTNKYNDTKEGVQSPISSFVMAAIGECLHKLKRYDELLTTITPHLDDGGDNGVYASYVGIAYCRKEHYETALQYLNRGVENGNDDDSDTWGYKGECHFFLGQYEKAIYSYQKSIEVRIPNDDDDFEIAYLEERIQTARQKLAQEKAKVTPSHITIQGNSAPINLGGILATDDAVINRAKVAEGSGAASRSAFCPGCGSPVEEGDLFCRKCGGKL